MASRSPISLRTFARQAGISPSTVSRAFNRPDQVAPETRETILKLARRAGFRPSAVARAAVGAATRSIGVLVPDLGVSYFADVARGIERALLGADHLPVLMTNNDDAGLRVVQRLLDHRVDGLLFGLSHEWIRQTQIEAITGADFPLVLVDQPHPGFSYDSVLNDDEDGGRQAAEHLVDLGHRHFGFVHYGEGTSNCDIRLAGFRGVLDAAGARLAPEHVVQAPVHGVRPSRHHAILGDLVELLRRPDRPTAIFAPSDDFAAEVIMAAREVGLSIPRDLSVVGFADLNFAALTTPPLTTIQQNGTAVGRQAAELILDRLREPQRSRRRVIVPTRLVVRGTTAPPPARAGSA